MNTLETERLNVVPFKKRSDAPAARDVASAVHAGQLDPAGAGRLIVVGGGKGGTGKSLIAANLALLASLQGRKVVLVDADLGLANLHLLLGIEPDADLSALLAPGWSSRRPTPDLLKEGPGGLRLLPGGSGVERLAGLNRGELRRLVHRLEPYLRGNDLVFLDLSSGVSPSTRLFLQAAHEVVIVSNPEPSAMLDAYGVVKLVSGSGHSGRFHLVMNRAHDLQRAQECAGRIRMTAQRFLDRGINYLGCVPEDEAVLASVQRRRPVVLDSPKSPAAVALETIARQLGDCVPSGDTVSLFFSTAKRLIAPRRRSKRSTCVL